MPAVIAVSCRDKPGMEGKGALVRFMDKSMSHKANDCWGPVSILQSEEKMDMSKFRKEMTQSERQNF